MTSVGGGTRTGAADEGIMLTTKGDIHSFDNEDKRLPVGPDGQILTADSLQALGVKWAAPAVGFNLTTKGDIHTFDTDQNRLGVGTNGQLLTANSAVALGIEWADPPSAEFLGPMTGTHDYDGQTLDNLGFLNDNSANPATIGLIRLGNDSVGIAWRNSANTNNHFIRTSGSNLIQLGFDGNVKYQFSSTQLVMGGNTLTMTNGDINLGTGELVFQNGGVSIAGIQLGNPNDLVLDLPTGGEFFMRINNVIEYQFGAAQLDLRGNNLNVGNAGGFIRFGSTDIHILGVGLDIEHNVRTAQEHRFRVNSVTEMTIDGTALTLGAGINLVLQGSGALGFIDIPEITVPANPAANVGRLYVKDVTATTTLFFRDSAGVETDLLAGGGGEFFGPMTNTHDYDGQTLDNFGVLISNATNPAAAGVIRLGNTEIMAWRNAANNADITLTVNALNFLEPNTSIDLNNLDVFDVRTLAFFGTEAGSGVIRMANASSLNWRNAGNTNDIGITVNASDDFVFAIDGGTVLTVSDATLALSQITIVDFITNTGLRWAGNINRLISNNTNGFFFKVPTADTFRFQVQAADATVISAASLTLRSGQNLVIEASGALGFIDIGEITVPANPAANIGRLYVKDVAATTTLFFRDNAGVETDLLAGGGEVFTWTNDHDSGNNNLLMGTGEIQFGLATPGLGPAGTTYIKMDSDIAFLFNVPTAETFSFRQNNVAWLTVVPQNDQFTLTDLSIRLDSGQQILWAAQAQRSITNNSAGTTFQVQAADFFRFVIGGAQILEITSGGLNLNNVNMQLGVSTGTKLGTATNQKLGFWNATPLVQQSVGADTLANLYTLLRAVGIVA